MAIHTEGRDPGEDVILFFLTRTFPPERDDQGKIIQEAIEFTSFYEHKNSRNAAVNGTLKHGEPGTVLTIGVWSRTGQSIERTEIVK